ncbi:MAG: prepilin-type N-terminal cleavage/methylation domain-containing protein [Deltaproteobacteria bacterium]|nr:prepilin-type N-terminal cleavage/methylation domain-containing protein [Deltaproteobacteria bacterium]
MKKKTHIIKDRAGFTLIEMFVAMAILAIVAGFAIPAFSMWLPNYRLKSAAREVFSNMQLAKLEAVKTNSLCAVTVSTTGNTYSLPSKTVSLDDYGSGVKFEGPSSGDTTDSPFTFNSRGMTKEMTDQHVYLTNAKNSAYFRITVTGIGNITINKWNGSTWE